MPSQSQARNQVWLTGFGDSAMNFELVVWPTLDAVKRPAAMQATEVDEAATEAPPHVGRSV